MWVGAGALGLDDAAATLPGRIERRIATLIAQGDLAPGVRLPSERELARIFKVSRLAVREAAHRLEARGLVVIRRGSGSFVATAPPVGEPDDGQQRGLAVNLDELADVRMLLEPAAADWAARRADRASLAILQRIAAQFESAAAGREVRFDLLGATDLELHLELARVADNALLVQLVEQLHGLYRQQIEWSLRRPGRLEETTAEHRRIVDAVVARSPAEARAAMEAHLSAAAASFRLTAREAPTD